MPRGLFLCDGRVMAQGRIQDVLRQYLDWTEKRVLERRLTRPRKAWEVVEIVAASRHDTAGRERYEGTSSEPLELRLPFRTRRPLRSPHINIGISDGRPGLLIHCSTFHGGGPPIDVAREWTTACKIERLNVMLRLYHLWCDVSAVESHDGRFCALQQVTTLKVLGDGELKGKLAVTLEALEGAVRTDHSWMHTVE